MSRQIERLDARIAQADGVLEREVLKARRAAVLARHGQFADARFALAGLRSQRHRLRKPVLGAWMALVEGLIEHCESFSPAARDKLRRAHELSSVAGDPALHAECAAWLSNLDLNANDLDATVAHAAEAVACMPADAYTAIARVALVIGNAWRIAGDDVRAQPWYERARQAAAMEGDVSLVSILLHNFAAFRAGRITLEDAFGRADKAEAQRVLLEAESTANYDAGVGNELLPAEVPLLRAQLMVVLDRHADAIGLIDAQLPRACAEGHARREARFLADAAYAEARLGRCEEAGRRLRLIQGVLPLLEDADDLAATHARLAVVSEALGRTDQADEHRAQAREALLRHEAEQRRWAEALSAAALG